MTIEICSFRGGSSFIPQPPSQNTSSCAVLSGLAFNESVQHTSSSLLMLFHGSPSKAGPSTGCLAVTCAARNRLCLCKERVLDALQDTAGLPCLSIGPSSEALRTTPSKCCFWRACLVFAVCISPGKHTCNRKSELGPEV